MSQSTGKTKQPCWAEFKCYYRIGNGCSYGQQVEAMLSELQEKYHKGSDCIISLTDIFNLPCIDLSEEERQHGIKNMLGT